MAIKAGQILWVGNGFVVDRLQTAGVTNLNVPLEKVHELGNYQVVAIVRDIPDLTFELQSHDVSTDLEALMLGMTPSAVVAGTQYSFDNSVPLNVISPFRSARNLYNINGGLVIPYLNLENVTYRFGLRASAEETFTLRGDAMYYVPGSPYQETFPASQSSYTFAKGPAIVYHEEGVAIYALGVSWYDSASGTYGRLFHGIGYTDTATGVTITPAPAAQGIPSTATFTVLYGSLTTSNYGPGSTTPSSVKPGAVRAKDLDVFLGSTSASSSLARVSGIQSFECTRRVTLQNDEEFGNPHYVAQDYDTADVNGMVGFKAVSTADLMTKAQMFSGAPSGEIAGPFTSPPLPLEAHVYDPVARSVLKSLLVNDATFNIPPLQSRVGQKQEVTFRYESNVGTLGWCKGTLTGAP